MKKHIDKSAVTKNNFVDAFIKLNKEKSIEKITVKELTEMSGYNRTTFYNYFTDIYNLYEYIEMFLFENIREQIEENMRNNSGKENFIRNFTLIYTQWSDYLAIVLKNPHSYHFSVQVKNILLSYWIKQFEIDENDIKTSYILDFYLSALISIISRWIKKPDDMSIEELACLLHEIIEYSILKKIIN
ncbi:TetR/AcrR family transcriptional regulator [Clostridioides difficile]|uniref:TetR/AcrR family transcriptional regulator n=1 Tax=Clostridioides difficile TaxID=1496 RepID=UPI0021C84680|nr:TetR/AcrR family transcriptional regulator [Clostridioides difficile]UUV16742.1 TetR/AcrR family transcriptional regulator [Clostridioides difficile]